MATCFTVLSPPMFHWCFCESQALCHFGESLFQWAPAGLVRSSLRNKVPWRRTARQMTWKSKLRTKGSWQILKGVFLTFVRFNFEISKTENTKSFEFFSWWKSFFLVFFSTFTVFDFFCWKFPLQLFPVGSWPLLPTAYRNHPAAPRENSWTFRTTFRYRFVSLGFSKWTAKWTKKNSTENTENTAQQFFFSLFCDFSPFWVFDSPFCLDRLRNEPLLSKDHDSECRRRTRSDQKLKKGKKKTLISKRVKIQNHKQYIYITSNRAFRMEEC